MALAVEQAGSGVNNTAFTFGVIALAFLFYITVRGDLPAWIGLILPNKSSVTSGNSSSAAGSNGLPSLPQLPSISSAPQNSGNPSGS